MKLKSILIIFFIAFLFTILIYLNYSNGKKLKVLILGDNYLYELTSSNYIKLLNDEYNVNYYYIDEYKKINDIIVDVMNNKCIYNKSNKECLNNSIAAADIIIINSDNNNYFSRCNKNIRIIKENNEKEYRDYIKLKKIISKISNAKVLIVGNYCSNYNKEIANNLNYLYSKDNYIDSFTLYKEHKNNFEYNIYKEIKVLIDKK